MTFSPVHVAGVKSYRTSYLDMFDIRMTSHNVFIDWMFTSFSALPVAFNCSSIIRSMSWLIILLIEVCMMHTMRWCTLRMRINQSQLCRVLLICPLLQCPRPVFLVLPQCPLPLFQSICNIHQIGRSFILLLNGAVVNICTDIAV